MIPQAGTSILVFGGLDSRVAVESLFVKLGFPDARIQAVGLGWLVTIQTARPVHEVVNEFLLTAHGYYQAVGITLAVEGPPSGGEPGGAPAPGAAWPATPFAVRTVTADVIVYQADRITPWGARPGGIVPVGYRMDVWLVSVFGGVEWLKVSVSPELWTRADHTALIVI